MDRLLTPLLRRVYLFFGAFLFVYLAVLAGEYSSWNKERLLRKLLAGTEAEQASAGFDLAYLKGEAQLLRALKSTSPQVRNVATSSLWELWARAGGQEAFRQIQAAHQAIEQHAFPKALQILTRITERHPAFAEGWNRRATLYWQMGRFDESIKDARKVVALNPNHFGAWQGLGLCHVQTGNFEEACRCLENALRITPHDDTLRRMLARCEELFHSLSPGERIHLDVV